MKGVELDSGSGFRLRVKYDDSTVTARELITALEAAEVTYLQPEGFVRTGNSGFALDRNGPEKEVVFEFTFSGKGTLWITDLRLLDISPVAQTFTGRPVVDRADWERMPSYQRNGLIVRPDRWWSPAGLRYLLAGYVPWRAWAEPLSVLGGWTLLLLAGSFVLIVILRRQWMESERFPLPVDQPVITLFGANQTEAENQGALPPVFRKVEFQAGLALALIWYGFVFGHAFNASIPSPERAVSLAGYIDSPLWGRTWHFDFALNLFILGLVLFIDLNVLASVLIGFLLFRLQFLVGINTGWSADAMYPHQRYQIIGGFSAYALLVPLLALRYLRGVAQNCFDPGAKDPETRAHRVAAVILAAIFGLVALGAAGLRLPVAPTLFFFLYALLLCLAAARLRCEAGIHHALAFGGWRIFTQPHLVLPFLGGIGLFSAAGFGLYTVLGTMVMTSVFFLLPGMQASFLEVGRRLKVRYSHVAAAIALGVAGGLAIGGWLYLTSVYAIGAYNYPLSEYGIVEQVFLPMKDNIGLYDSAAEQGASGPLVPALDIRFGAMAYGAAATAAVTLLRIISPGFWFHPVGIIVAPSSAMDLWAVFLAAFAIRYTVLKLGGASTVREKLFPLATGLIAGSAGAYFLRYTIQLILEIVNPGGGP